MQLVFNELSVPGHGDIYNANKYMEQFLKVFFCLRKTYPSKISGELLSPVNLHQIELVSGYNAAQWAKHSGTDRELCRFFKNMCEHVRYITPENDEYLCTTVDGTSGDGIQLSVELGCPALSFAFLPPWQKSSICCSVYSAAEESITSTIIPNFSSEESISIHKELIDMSFRNEIQAIRSGDELLEFLCESCPSLVLFDVARQQILQTIERLDLPILAQKLVSLEDYFSSWDGVGFDQTAFPPRTVSPESTETLQRFKDDHTFKHNGVEYLVSYHLRYTCKASRIPGRIYFFPDSKTHKGLICSVHTKLPSVSNPEFKGKN